MQKIGVPTTPCQALFASSSVMHFFWALRDPLSFGKGRQEFLPQICHKPKRVKKDFRGFLRVTAGREFVAKTGGIADFFP